MAVDDETKTSGDTSKDIVIDSMSPYFIHSGDKPGDVHVTTILRDGNYGDWFDEMSNALYAKNKFGFVNGDILMPKSDSPYLPYWQRANAIVKAWLNSSMEAELRQSVKFKTAHEIWVDLKERFEKDSAPRAYELRCSLGAIRQDGQSISAYFSQLCRIWDEMASINIQASCTCGNCSCNVSKLITESRDRERLYDFLMGLDDIYGHLKTQILATRPVPSLSTAYHLISESEQHRSIASACKPSGEGTVFHTQPKKDIVLGRRSNPKEGRSCSHCGRTNHTYDACFERIGYPPNWNLKHKESKFGGRAPHQRIGSVQGGGRENNFERRQSIPRAAHVNNRPTHEIGLSEDQLHMLAKLMKDELQDHVHPPSSFGINMAGITLEEADWGGSKP
ncbi:unnamed protein product [Cuscuta epithymum]|uniref:Retrotransposon Copia-like N-terminal domain-containing protein n=1 Tax=Cuscuta epithymum TaxID=186058 RepID=A0AAV0F1N3_9ASTE|nr:unnamed protein product [Cuscuta epithymum]